MRTLRIVMALLVVSVVSVACGGGGGGSLEPPAFTNLQGTRWNVTDTVSAANSCGAGVGVTDQWVLQVLAQSGNAISFYDERGTQADAVNGTMSGYVISYSGERYPLQGCSNMTASYSVTVNNAGTSFSGTATITCNDAPACSVPVSVYGSRI